MIRWRVRVVVIHLIAQQFHFVTSLIAPKSLTKSWTCPPTHSSALFVAERQAADPNVSSPLDRIETNGEKVKITNNMAVKENRVRRLRDFMWIRETVEDLTAAEFALNLDQTTKRGKRAVDYDNLLSKLQIRIRDLCCDRGGEGECFLDRVSPDKGMGQTVYSIDQRNDLLKRLIQTRKMLMETMHRGTLETENGRDPSLTIPLLDRNSVKDDEPQESLGPKLYIREDGTVDWDGALQDQAALKNFGTAVWARINGRDPDDVDSTNRTTSVSSHSGEKPTVVTAKIDETPDIRREKEILDQLETEYKHLDKKHLALLNSAIIGKAVANINLATLAPELRREINDSYARLEKKREEVVYQRLIYELERVYTYLAGEMGNPSNKGYIPLQDRLNVAEFGLLESQIISFQSQIEAGEFVDADILAVVSDQVIDFKRRLGIDYYVTGLTFDKEAILKFCNELLDKTKKGLAFYVKGCKLLWNDLVYASSLVLRALQGYILKPREVRNLRRTFKDLITFIPVVIILIIPLSPIGHVLVFGAIQRVFPDFFPSCFTERRQNLLQLYENTEYSEVTIDETFSEKVARVLEAIIFQIAKYAQSLVASLRGDDSSPKA